MDVAARILAVGEVRCRNAAGPLLCDVANQGALWNNPDAHNYVRLYFRPRNSFHLKTEGIKRIGSPYRQDPHMSVPVMLAFDLERVLTSEGAFFLPSNFAHAGAQPQNGDAAFGHLNFSKIYHDSPTNAENRAEIHDARMAEVVFDRPLSLDLLTAVVCRTAHELETLKSFVPPGTTPRNMVVEQNGSMFMRREIYLNEIYTQDGHIYIGITNWAGADPKVTYRLTSVEGTYVGELIAKKVYFSSFKARDPDTVWTLELEGCLAYRGRIPSAAGVV